MIDHLEVIEEEDEDGYYPACVCGWEGTYHDTFEAARVEWQGHLATEGTEP